MKKLLALLIACLAFTITACGDDDDGGDSADTGTTTAPAEQHSQESGETVTVDMKDIKYVPENVTVKVGTTVKWTNSDEVPHTVTKDGGPGEDFDSGNIDGGGEYEQAFHEAGKIDYVCTIHPGQEGSITVEGTKGNSGGRGG